MLAVLLHSDTILDHHKLVTVMPGALARVMADQYGGEEDTWQRAYQQLTADWDSYWADLDLSGEDSLAQWREGRWRIVRAHFRLAGQSTPSVDQLSFCLDVLPRRVGQRCGAIWHRGAVEGLRTLAGGGAQIGIVAPYQSSALVWGLADAVGLGNTVNSVLGPDELGQVGLEGITWSWLARLAGSDATHCILVSPEQMPGARMIAPPDDLSVLPDLLRQAGYLR